MTSITLYHNPNCSKSRATLELLRASTQPFTVVEYLQTPPTQAELESLLAALDVEPAELVRKDGHFRELGLDAADYVTAEQVVSLLLAHPKLMQRPIGLRAGRAVIGRPPENINELLG